MNSSVQGVVQIRIFVIDSCHAHKCPQIANIRRSVQWFLWDGEFSRKTWFLVPFTFNSATLRAIKMPIHLPAEIQG